MNFQSFSQTFSPVSGSFFRLLFGLVLGLSPLLWLAFGSPLVLGQPRPATPIPSSTSDSLGLPALSNSSDLSDSPSSDLSSSSDYFEAIRPSAHGYLIWQERPVKVYVQPESPVSRDSGSDSVSGPLTGSAQIWSQAVAGALADWSTHFPIEQTSDPDAAQIIILRRQPPLSWPPQAARNAQTQFRLFSTENAQGAICWHHQQTIYLGDRQSPEQLRGTARHELGHALGLWGHSDDPNDALYEQQVGVPPSISARDIRTLNRVYQQPTQLGCQDKN